MTKKKKATPKKKAAAKAKAPAKKRTKAGTSKEAAHQRRLVFIEAYITNGGNATEAAKTAGFSDRSAYARGHELVKDREVAEILAARQKKLQEEHGLTTERLLKELAAIAFADLRKVFDEKGALLPPNLWPDEVAAAMAGVDVVELAGAAEVGGEGGIKHIPMFTKKVKLWDKNAAIEKAMKHLGLFKTEVSGPNGGPIPVSISGDVKLTPTEAYLAMLNRPK